MSNNDDQLTDSQFLDKMQKILDFYKDREVRAKNRLAKTNGSWWCFAIVGLDSPLESFDSEYANLRKVEEPPHFQEWAEALKDNRVVGRGAGYLPLIHRELAISADIQDLNGVDPIDLGKCLISALKVRSGLEFIVPMVANTSWSTIPGVPKDFCKVQMLEDFPKARTFDASGQLTEADWSWSVKNITEFVRLLGNPPFRLAVDSLTTHMYQASSRMAVAALWGGIEALLNVESELRFRISTYVASYLRPFGEERLTMSRRMKKLYDVRSRAVHGAAIEPAEIESHVVEVRRLLSELLCKIVADGELPSTETFERRVFVP